MWFRTEDISRSCPSIRTCFTCLITIHSSSMSRRYRVLLLQAPSTSVLESRLGRPSADGDGGLVRDSYGLLAQSSSIVAHGPEGGSIASDMFTLMYIHGRVRWDRE